jgi:hypothetical protein
VKIGSSLRGKRRIMEKHSNISPPFKNIIFQKSSKRNQTPSKYNDFVTNGQVSTQAKKIIFQKSSYKNRPIIIIIT